VVSSRGEVGEQGTHELLGFLIQKRGAEVLVITTFQYRSMTIAG
jgi:hypothetical protein